MVAFASCVAGHKAKEFEILQASVNLFEGINPALWVVRPDRIDAIEEAWKQPSCEAVIYADPGVVVTSPFLGTVLGTNGDVVLSPYYCHESRAEEEHKIGSLSAAFLLVRSRRFTSWWRAAASQPGQSDQLSLQAAAQHFSVGMLGRSANVGFWRGSAALEFPPIPRDCLFLNAPLFQPAVTAAELVKRIFATSLKFGLGGGEYRPAFSGAELTDKAFALHCLEFLRTSESKAHKVLLSEIVARDGLGLYAA